MPNAGAIPRAHEADTPPYQAAMGLAHAPTSPFQELGPRFQDLAALRQQDSLHYSTQLDAYVVTRYDDIVAILEQPGVFGVGGCHGILAACMPF